MALQTGRWTVNGNGFPGELVVQAVDAEGNLAGTVYNQAIEGFWDEASQKIVFMRKTDQANPSTFQIWT